MDPIAKKTKQWIDAGKDPRSAHWQAGLEAMLAVFSPYLTPGRLSPVQSLEEVDIRVFKAVSETADLSPDLTAAFLPPPIAGKIVPPDTAPELERIDKGKPSYKLLISRPGKELRILCAEISPHAKKPGADIFQEGTLLGSYDYGTYDDCISGLTKTIKAHIWQKGKWGIDQHRRYTVNWFEKVLGLQSPNISVDPDFSFLHSSTLIKGNRVDAIFMLISEITENRLADSESGLQQTLSTIKTISDQALMDEQITEVAERGMLECLNIMRDFNIIDFSSFSDKENEQFKNEFSGTMEKLIRKLQT